MKLLWYIEVYIIYNYFYLIYVCDSVYLNTHSIYSYFYYGLLKHFGPSSRMSWCGV